MFFKPGKAVVPANASGSAPDAAVTPNGEEISFDIEGNSQAVFGVFVTNREAVAGNPLEISFNNGKGWFVIATNTSLAIPVVIHRVRVRGASGGASLYSVMGIK
jgi:hypothetical protein